MKKGQAALEFLTTYGWAFIVVLVMIGALSHFGVFNPITVGTGCVSEAGFGCESTLVTDTSQKFKFKNNLGTEIALAEATVTVKSTGETITCTSPSGTINEGDLFELDCGGTLIADKRENLDISFKYYPAQGSPTYAKSVTATISNKVQNSQEYTQTILNFQEVNSCITINEPYTEYTLTADLQTTGNCITITASDVTLDCTGHTITGGNTQDLIWDRVSDAITIEYANRVTVKNCVLKNFTQGIYYLYSNDGHVYNNQLSDSFHGVHTLWSNRITINNNQFYNVTKYNVVLERGINHKVYSNTFNAPVLQGLSRGVALTSEYTEVYNNEMINMGYALWTCCGTAHYNNFHDNAVVNSTFAILAFGGSNNVFENNNLQNARHGLYVWDMQYSNFTNNNIHVYSPSTSYGIFFRKETNQNNNRFVNNAISGSPTYGVFIDHNPNTGIFSKNNTFTGTTISGATNVLYIRQFNPGAGEWYTLSSSTLQDDLIHNNTFQ